MENLDYAINFLKEDMGYVEAQKKYAHMTDVNYAHYDEEIASLKAAIEILENYKQLNK